MSYTKISNSDRRKTARRLRDAANCRNVQISPSALGRLIKAEDRSYRGILRTLAEPLCHQHALQTIDALDCLRRGPIQIRAEVA